MSVRMAGAERRRIWSRRSRAARQLGAPAVIAVTSVLLLCGCGSSYTKADFVSRANGICLSAVRDLRLLSPGATGGVSGDQALAAYLGRALPIVRREAEQLRGLPRPPVEKKGRAELDAYFAALRQAVDGYGVLARSAQRGDSASVDADLAALQANPLAQLAARYGLRYCGTPEATIR